jgi:nicotinamide mononucleotide (NMN) deamidase PncC
MFSEEQKEIVKKINDSNKKLFFVICGGGASFIGDYLSISGASKVLEGAFIPYSKNQIECFLGAFGGLTPQTKFVSKEQSENLAISGFMMGFNSAYDEVDKECISISCTASLAKDGERTGRGHDAYISIIKTNFGTEDFKDIVKTFYFTFNSTRENEEKELSAKILDILAKECKI